MYSVNGKFQTGKKNIEKFGQTNKSYKMLTPATLFNFFEKKNVAIVNTLKNPYYIVKKPFDNKYLKIYYSAEDFMKMKYKDFDLIILYCANYTCAAAKNYAKKLVEKYPKYHPKIVLYEGGLFEWSNLALNYTNFGIYHIDEKRMLDEDELYDVNQTFPHWLEKKHDGFQKIVYDNVADDNFYKSLNKFQSKTKPNVKLLEGKVCVVTGATSGLGLETLKKMLDNGARHVTGTFYNNVERAKKVLKELIKKYGSNRIKIIQADARTEKGNLITFSPSKRSKYLPKDLVPINCVDINAGIFGPANKHKKHIFNIKDDDYDEVMKLNLRGYYLGVKHFSKQAIENNVKDGSIVCIKSIYGSTGSLFSNPAYQISKHGTMGLVRQSAVEMARPNKELGLKYPIRVNAVSPTFTDTALTKPMLNYKKVNDTISNSNTTGELAKKEDVANAVVFLCSELSGSVTGVDLPVDCGVLSESVPTYPEVRKLNDDDKIDILSCCGDTV